MSLPQGAILVTSDAQDGVTGDAVVLNPSTGAVISSTASLPFSSRGDRLANGTLAMTTETSSSVSSVLGMTLVDSQLNLIAAVTTIPFTAPWNALFAPLRASDSFFYVISDKGSTGPQLHQVSPTGTVGTTWTLPLPGGHLREIICMTPSADDTKVYYAYNSDHPGVMRAYDLVNSAPLSNFLTLGSTDTFGQDVFLLPNRDMLVIVGLAASSNFELRRYNSSAVLQSTIALGAAGEFEAPEMFRDVSTDNIWVRTFPDATGHTSTFTQFEIASGSTLATWIVNTLDGSGTVPSTCPNFALGVSIPGPSQQVFVGTAATMPIRRERTVPIPVADGNARQTISRLEVQFQPGTGIVDDPLGEPKFMLQVSWDHGKTWSNERLMNAGREGRYLTRAYVNIVGQGRYPVVRIVTSDTFLPVMTGCSVWIAESAH